MNKSVFDILGPIMIGPSSSHTAGAARIGRLAREMVGGSFENARCLLHGSFAATYKGHGTDIAIVAGLMGIKESDESLKDAYAIAEKAGKRIAFETAELPDVHENTVKIIFDEGNHSVVGSSLGGGAVMITEFDGFKVNIAGNYTTLIVTQIDKSGVVSEVSGALAAGRINIGTMSVSRRNKGELACMVIECDGDIPEKIINGILTFPDVLSAICVQKIY